MNYLRMHKVNEIFVLFARHNDAKTFLVWVNEEDHTRMISMEKGGDMKAVFKRFCEGITKVIVGKFLSIRLSMCSFVQCNIINCCVPGKWGLLRKPPQTHELHKPVSGLVLQNGASNLS